MKKTTLTNSALLLPLFFSISTHGFPKIPESNNPDYFDTHWNKLPIDRNFENLPLRGQMEEHIPYTDDYWAYKKGGINFRWNSTGSDKQRGFEYNPPKYKDVLRMSKEDLMKLSPAEKFDLAKGDYKYKTYKEVASVVSPSAESWEGICNGWAAAALNHAEPQATLVRNPDGIEIPFGSSDVKALLAYAYDTTFKFKFKDIFRKRLDSDRAFIGEICRTDISEDNVDPEKIAACADTNAGAFHIILGNQMGIQKRGFLIDYDKGHEIWNQPAFAYQTEVLDTVNGASAGAAPGTVREVRVITDLFFTAERAPEWEPTVGTSRFGFNVAKYQYRLELNAQNQIIGGAWEKRESSDLEWIRNLDLRRLSSAGLSALAPMSLETLWLYFDRPDDLWLASKVNFVGRFEALNQIYKPIQSSAIQVQIMQDSVDFVHNGSRETALSRLEAQRQAILNRVPDALR